jgi:phospholipid/cholesterol/gamma-HCH transport system substrate-binding protein
MSRTARTVKLAAVAVSSALLLAGCGGIYDIPLPGGADLGSHPYTVKVQFQDVLDLVPQAGVKVNEVSVGRVESIGLTPDGWHAEVTVRVNGDVRLPANALANVRQSSLLGEKYVELSSPGTGQANGNLVDGAVIPLQRTNRGVEVEEVLGALSLLLNGGGVDQLNTITKELNEVTVGHEADLKNLLANANQLVTTLDSQSADITRALDGVNRLASTLDGQRAKIANALDNLGPGIGVLAQQRGQLVRMLQALQQLSSVATNTINQSKDDVVADLKALLPTLQKLGEAGSDLPKALEILLTYPFNDAAISGVKGDYFNLFAKIDLNLSEIVKNLTRSSQNPLNGLLPASPTTSSPQLTPQLPLGGLPASGGQPGGSPLSGLGGVFDLLAGGGS